ncbi:glycosyltransferase [Pedobacter sp. SJ11]|uniref:Glycosyltransferase n=1 Tax=Pedobacter rhodius TaxID=3004098 RepID=A0ABT4KU90_9SPHI|nr:glycosyltransferase [Pedobacter sp. SJ11]MCZ4221807.1 glycosyltransferase [Pedobacter sp. SJ11]
MTVLLPVYNGEPYLKVAIESILVQTFKNFELLIVNDGSTDQTEKIVKSFNDNRIVYIKKDTNQGIVASLNEGFKLAKGEFIARMDADDISLPTRLQQQYDFLKQNPEIAILGSHFQIVNAAGYGTDCYLMPLKHEALKVMLFFGSPFAHPTVMMRKDEFVKHNLWYREEFKHVEDYDLWSRALLILKGANYDEVLLNYRISNQQIASRFSKIQQQTDEKIKKRLLGMFPLTSAQIDLLYIFFQNGVSLNQVNHFEEICSMLQKLSIINNEIKILNSEVFEQEIAKKTDIILNVYANAKNKLYLKYKQSYFFKFSQLSFKQRAKIWFKQYTPV